MEGEINSFIREHHARPSTLDALDPETIIGGSVHETMLLGQRRLQAKCKADSEEMAKVWHNYAEQLKTNAEAQAKLESRIRTLQHEIRDQAISLRESPKLRVKCDSLIDQLKQQEQNHTGALVDSQEKADVKVKRLQREEQKLRTDLEHKSIDAQVAQESYQKISRAKSEAQTKNQRALHDARELRPLIGEVTQLRAKCKDQSVHLDKLQRRLAQVSSASPSSSASHAEGCGLSLGQQCEFQELKEKLKTRTEELKQLRYLKEDLEDERERGQALKNALEIEEFSASDFASQVAVMQEQQEQIEAVEKESEVLTELDHEQKDELKRLRVAVGAASERQSESLRPDEASREQRVADAEKALQKATEQRDALQCEVWMQQGAHATEIASMAQAQRVATALLQGELETQWLGRQERQRDSDALILEAHLRARFLEEELGLEEELDAQRSRADALEDQLGSIRSKTHDLQGKLAAADENYEKRLVEVEHANILRMRGLEAQIAVERRDHADARVVENRRARRLEEALKGPNAARQKEVVECA